jgi:predicted outer membrane repeat protein
VRADQGGAVQDGLSWKTSFRTIQQAIDAAGTSGEIWIAAGSYQERLTLPAGVSLYGGFAGTESARAERNVTRLTLVDAQQIDRPLTVAEGAGPDTVVDGLTLAKGYPHSAEGALGIGGAVYLVNASPTIQNVSFRLNTAIYGGAIYCRGGSPRIANCVFDHASAEYGGAVYIENGSPALVNSTFFRAGTYTSNTSAGAVYITGAASKPAIVNNLILRGEGVMMDAANPGEPVIRNNCLYGVPAPFIGMPSRIGQDGNISAAPQVASETLPNFHLQPTSPCRDRGNNTVIAPDDRDMDGAPRAPDGAVDIGADEADGTLWSLHPAALHVALDGNDFNDGLTWGSPMRTLAEAVRKAAPGDEVWVREGVYEAAVSAYVYSGVGVYGGFAGTETMRSQRDPARHPVVLSAGLYGTAAINLSSTDDKAVVDGFTIQGRPGQEGRGVGFHDSKGTLRNCTIRDFIYLTGYATALSISGRTPLIENCVIQNCASLSGSALSVDGAAHPTIRRCTFRHNGLPGANQYGGAVRLTNCGADIVNNVFAGNATGLYGGAVAAYNLYAGQSVRIINNTFCANSAAGGGGAVFVSASDTAQRDVVFANNIVDSNFPGVQISAKVAASLVRNNLFHSNGTYDYVGDNPIGKYGNIAADPGFADASHADFHLRPGSAAIDVGADSYAASGALDQDGQPRLQGAHVDIGADEFDGTAPPPPTPAVAFVRPDGDDAHTGRSWATAKRTVSGALASLVMGEVWVARGSYPGRACVFPGQALYGGFAGTEADRAQAAPSANPTVLDGEQTGPIVTMTGGSVALDGFTITNGKASVGAAGVQVASASPRISRNRFVNNSVIDAAFTAGSSPLFVGNVLAGRPQSGGASVTSARGAAPVIASNVFTGIRGTVLGIDGAGQVVNNTFAANGLSSSSSAILAAGSSALIANNIFCLNRGYAIGGGDAIKPQIRRNMLWLNGGLYADFTFGAGGDPNMIADPKLASIPGGDFHIQPDSPARDAGDPAAVGAGWPDMDGQRRVIGAGPDIGADESDGTAWPSFAIRVRPDGDDSADGAGWPTAKMTVGAALAASPVTTPAEVWLAEGVYPTSSASLPQGVTVLGGFAGNETTHFARNPALHPSVLDGGAASGIFSANYARGVTLDGVSLRNGKAANGAAILAYSGEIEIRNCAFAGNVATMEGGAIFAHGGSLRVAGCTFEGNSAVRAGAIRSSDGTLVVRDTRFSRNRALAVGYSGIHGGAIYGSASSAIIERCVFEQNSALRSNYYEPSEGYGGAISLASSPSASIVRCRFTGNVGYSGGALSLTESAAGVSECVFAGNLGTQTGGAIALAKSTGVLAHNTIVANVGGVEGGGIQFTDSAAAVANNIVAFNTSGMNAAGPALPALSHNIISGNRSYAVKGMTDPIGAAGNTSSDPLLASLAYGNLHIQPGSPARDAADPAFTTSDPDIDGQPRIQGSAPDIGADESDGTAWTEAPTVIRVSSVGDDGRDGATWATAKRTIGAAQNALSGSGGEVRVARGVYPGSVSLLPFVYLRGGFSGKELGWDDQNPAMNVTVLDAEAYGAALSVEGILYGSVDGVTLRNGAGAIVAPRQPTPTRYGGGLFLRHSSLPISRCVITACTAAVGGGVFVDGGAPDLSRLRVYDNSAAESGGGICLYATTSARVTSSLISGNRAVSGAGVAVSSRTSVVSNNTIVSNTASESAIYQSGGGIFVSSPGGSLLNNIVAYNTSGIAAYPNLVPFMTVRANDVFGNTKANYYYYPDQTRQNGNVSTEPRFVDRLAGDYRLQPMSPCIDAAVGTAPVGGVDLDGNPRQQGAHIDMGAYELPVGASITVADVARALRLAGGLASATLFDRGRLNTGAAGPGITLEDAVLLLRQAAGMGSG